MITNSTKTDLNTEISYIKSKVMNFIKKRNWLKYHTPKNLIQAMYIELAELAELFLFKDFNKQEIYQNENLLENIKNEIADVFIYLISFINSLDIDITSAFIEKMQINKQKYPIEEFYDGKYYKK